MVAMLRHIENCLATQPYAPFDDIHLQSGIGNVLSTLAFSTLTRHRRILFSQDTCPPPEINILEIVRITPKRIVWEAYKLKVEELKEKHREGCSTVSLETCMPRRKRRGVLHWNEVFLWHGCSPAVGKRIVHNGFDPRLAGMRHGTMFGQGAYFAEHFSKADFYAKQDRHDNTSKDPRQFMLLCLVCLGEGFRAMENMSSLTLPPCARCKNEVTKACTCSDKDMSLDSVSAVSRSHGGCVDLPEHIVYAGSQIVPIAGITYEHVASCACAVCCRAN